MRFWLWTMQKHEQQWGCAACKSIMDRGGNVGLNLNDLVQDSEP